MTENDLSRAVIAAALIQAGYLPLQEHDPTGQRPAESQARGAALADLTMLADALGGNDMEWRKNPQLALFRQLLDVVQRMVFERIDVARSPTVTVDELWPKNF